MKNSLPAIVFLFILLSSCKESNYSPKPRAYFRIDFPEKSYQVYQNDCPFEFDIPQYTEIKNDQSRLSEPCWLNLHFNNYGAVLHMSYKEVENNLKEYLEDSRNLASKHIVKASAIDEKLILRDNTKVFGLVYEIEGNTASSLQFYLTDSTHHFLRGALYFNASPNEDSIAPVLSFVKEDVYHLINTLKWKN